MLKIKSLRCFDVQIPLAVSFSHAAADRDITETVLVEITDESGITGYGEGCPRHYVTGETVASAIAFCRVQGASINAIHHFGDLARYQARHRRDIDRNPAAWCAVELAVMDLIGKLENKPIEALLKPAPKRERYKYSAVLGDSNRTTFEATYQLYRSQQFSDFKIKLNGDLAKDQDKLACLRDDLDEITLRADANNLWHSVMAATTYLQALDIPFVGIEEPIESKDINELSLLAHEMGIKVILDESFLRFDQITKLAESPYTWVVNTRVSKLGGLIRSLEIVEELVRYDIDITIGCQVGESSLLTRAALVLADAAGEKLKSQEGAFGKYLLSQDPFSPCLQFGQGGYLGTEELACRQLAGLGLTRNPTVPLGSNPHT